jgi:hypothetical protein
MLRFRRTRLMEINMSTEARLYDPEQRRIPLTEDRP